MHGLLLAFAGFGGAGKTTAIDYFVAKGLGTRIYLGQCVLDEIERQGLVRSAATERTVRMQMRSQLGKDALASKLAPRVKQLVDEGGYPLIDAIFNPEEFTNLKQCGQSKSTLIGIAASFETRSTRLAIRANRVHTAEELKARDKIEKDDLDTPAVLRSADFLIDNEGSFEALQQSLDAIWADISVTRR